MNKELEYISELRISRTVLQTVKIIKFNDQACVRGVSNPLPVSRINFLKTILKRCAIL